MKLDILIKNDNQSVQKNIISKIRELINYKNLEPGDKLPSERMLSEKFEVSRSNVREAIQKLEFYGLLELKTVRLAALRRTEEDLEHLKNTLDAYSKKALNGEDAVQEDLLFHLAIAKASGNSTMNTLMLTITPEIITNFEKYHVCDSNQATLGIQEHEAIYDAIEAQDPKLAKQKMKEHFKVLYQYCYNLK